MNLTYEIINDGTGYMIKNDGVNWIMQDSYIPFPGAIIEESAQNHIDDIVRMQELQEQEQREQQTLAEQVKQLEEENEALRASQAEQDALIMELMIGGTL